MAREFNTDSVKIEQRAPISDASSYDGDVILGEKIGNADYLDELKFMEEPILILIQPSSEPNAAGAVPVWCNGKGAEAFFNNRWNEITYLPVGQQLTIKRKILEVMLRSKTDTVHTRILDEHGDRPNNVVNRFTRSTNSISVLQDRSPRGGAWMTEMLRRNV